MTSRTYALILIVGAATLFLGLAATNVLLDPWWVFRVSPLHSPVNVNDRYDFYRVYMAEPDRYDAALFASSRGLEFSLDDLSRHTAGATYAQFSVSTGRLDDHRATLDFLVRDKAARGGRLRQVFLLIDLDSFGEPALYPDDLQLLQPPAISGEPAFHFWWRNLTAIQVPAWQRTLWDAAKMRGNSGALAPQRNSIWPSFAVAAHAEPAGQTAVRVGDPGSTAAGAAGSLVRVTERPRFSDDMRNWARIVELCREHNIHLIAALSPMHPGMLARLHAADVANVAEAISRLAPVWDFSDLNEPSNREEVWYSPRHYHTSVARMMLGRIFAMEVPAEWRNFGRLRAPASQ